jgi:hypothetical protein
MDFAPKRCRKPQTKFISTNSKIFLRASLFSGFSKRQIACIEREAMNTNEINRQLAVVELSYRLDRTVAIILIAIPLLGFALGMIAAWLA